MPSVQYMNRSAPFWDFVANLEQEGTNHPFFNQWSPNRNNNTESSDEGPHGRGRAGHSHPPHPPPFGPWGWGFPFGGGRGVPHRGPPPPPGPSAPHHEEQDEDMGFEKNFEKELNKEFDEDNNEKTEKEKDNDNGEGPSGSGSETEGCCRRRGERRRGGPCGSGYGRHGHGPRGWGVGGPGAHHGGPHSHGRRGGWGGWGRWGRGGPFGGSGGGNSDPLAFFASLFDPESATKTNEDEDFSPEADIFDTPSSFVIHVSLPGAKKEDVGVNWDIEKSELSIAGVIYRPGDEKFLEQLATSERKVGAFERKIRLGTRANPANVDADQITAKLEDGVLRVEVPKLGENGFVEVRRVDIE
ncbi:HSP20-like chaperone [Byssothecium circinans]|uniref:HSP20-like chaperone n=1 Tax=Byssothecium circinans TaxID=147558 RepID=A0A6A5TVJ9_9PLEO|nr:HSP20-like chaperone [Byssothecium circinans]